MLTHRRQREGLRWRTDKPPRRSLWQTLKDAIFIVVVLFGVLLVHGWTVEQDLKAQLEDQQRLTRQADARTASLMNGRGLHDKTDRLPGAGLMSPMLAALEQVANNDD